MCDIAGDVHVDLLADIGDHLASSPVGEAARGRWKISLASVSVQNRIAALPMMNGTILAQRL
jgi:hypothetical protein